MSKSKPEDNQLYTSGAANPFCPVCGEGDKKVRPTGADPGEKNFEAHSCLLSIMNAHYVLSKKEMGKLK